MLNGKQKVKVAEKILPSLCSNPVVVQAASANVNPDKVLTIMAIDMAKTFWEESEKRLDEIGQQ